MQLIDNDLAFAMPPLSLTSTLKNNFLDQLEAGDGILETRPNSGTEHSDLSMAKEKVQSGTSAHRNDDSEEKGIKVEGAIEGVDILAKALIKR